MSDGAATPGETPARTRSLFSQTFRDAGSISRRHFLPLFFVMLCGAATRLLLPPLNGPEVYGLPAATTHAGPYLLTQIGTLLSFVFTSLIVTFASLQHLGNMRVDYRTVLRGAGSRFLIVCIALLVIVFFIGLAILAITMAISFLGEESLGKTAANWLTGLWLALSVGSLYVSLFIFTPVVAIERRGLWPSFRQALFLTRGHRWKILLILLAALLALFAFNSLMMFIILVTKLVPPDENLKLSQNPYVATVETAFVGYVATILQAALYYRLRQIKQDPLIQDELI